MEYHSVEEIFSSIDASRQRLQARLEELDEAARHHKQTGQTWSAAEIAEHLAVIERRMAGLLSSLLEKAEANENSKCRETTQIGPISLARFAERSRAEKFAAPEAVRPQGGVSISTSLANLQTTRETLRALQPRIEALDLSAYTFPHPVFGPLNFYEWLLFIGAHEERHLRQIERGLKSSVNQTQTETR